MAFHCAHHVFIKLPSECPLGKHVHIYNKHRGVATPVGARPAISLNRGILEGNGPRAPEGNWC